MGLFKDNKDLDTTLMAITALIVGVIVPIGLMVLHHLDKENDLLSPEIVMALIQLPGIFAAYALGKRMGQQNGGNSK